MAADNPIDKAKEEIIALATGKDRISGKTQFTKSRNKLDALLAKVEKENDKKEILRDINTSLKKKGLSITYIFKGDTVAEFNLTHDVFGESMEPDYYWTLDFLRENFGFEVEKSADFFASSESSGYFGEMGGRRTAMESRIAGGGGAQGLFGTINMVIKSMINLLYDLKTFDVRLSHYKDLKSPSPGQKQTAMDALKGIWLNEVDKTKGNAAIDVLAAQLNFITLRDSFMIVPVHEWYKADADSKKISEIKDKAIENVKKMDLTAVVIRILGPRVKEFIDWLYLSEKELNMRYRVERTYLKAQNDALKVYTKWARPYLISANKLMPAEYEDMLKRHKELGLGSAATPSSFHAVQMYLELFGIKPAKLEVVKMPGYIKSELKLSKEREDAGDMPLTAIEVRIAFRGAPVTVVGARQERGYGFTGKKVFMFVGYVLQKKHYKLLQEFKDDEVLDFIDNMTKNSLDAMHDDLEKYMKDEKEEKKEEKKQFKLAIPFSKFIRETFGTIKKFQQQAQGIYKSMPKFVRGSKDAWNLARLILVGEESAKKLTFKVYDIFKKQHGMPTPP
jgi:hypothetical protein